MIQMRDVDFHPEGQRILEAINLDIQPGELFVIMGASGAGKSTILRLMNGLIKPSAGRVLYDGRDITSYSEAQLAAIRRQVGMVFQSAALFDSLSVADNVGFAWRKDKLTPQQYLENVRQTLRIVGLEGVEERMPAELSGGMRKRVGLARTIAMNPKVLLYDEPTAGLDPTTSKRILDLIADLRTRLEVTSVMVTHDLDGAFAIADRVALLHEARIRFVGTVAEMEASTDPLVRGFISGEQVMVG